MQIIRNHGKSLKTKKKAPNKSQRTFLCDDDDSDNTDKFDDNNELTDVADSNDDVNNNVNDDKNDSDDRNNKMHTCTFERTIARLTRSSLFLFLRRVPTIVHDTAYQITPRSSCNCSRVLLVVIPETA